MIYKIAIENFFSIAGRQELDFAIRGNAPDLACFKSSLSGKDIRLPTVIGFFGPNASGKSTVLEAVVSTIIFAVKSCEMENAALFFQPYRQKEWLDKPTKVLIEFDGKINDDADSAMFRYELHVSHTSDLQTKEIAYEALSYAPRGKFRMLFERTGSQFRFGKEFGISNDDPRRESIRPNAGVISTLRMFNHPVAMYISQQLGKMQISGFTRQENIRDMLNYYHQDKNCLDRLIKELRRLDVGIENMLIEQGPQGLFAKLQHTGLDGYIFLEEESEGTKRFIEIFPRLHYALETGSIALIDELDIHFHPIILPELFRWFSDPVRNPNGAQLLFAAHNPILLDELEKEQIFFTEKLTGMSTEVYGARDIEGLRRAPSLMKKYLSGELGAVPRIG